MAAEVGTPVTGTGDPASGSVATSAKSTTSGNSILVYVKWENPTTPTLTSVTDTAGNSYTIDQQAIRAGDNEPHGAIAYCMNATGNASNVITANFSAATATFRKIIAHEFSGLEYVSPIDGTSTNNNGSGTSYTTGDITTTTTGLVFAGISGFTTLSSKTANGTPAFSLGDSSLSDTFTIKLISSSAQTVSPAASSSTSNIWVMLATAFKDSGGLEIDATPGTWDWSGTQAALTRGPETAFQQNAFQSNAFQIYGGTTGAAGVTEINATPGVWNWAGTQATIPTMVAATPGAWNWAGTTASTTQLINAGVGAWSWAGSTASTTQLINASPGVWDWSGTNATTTQLINASPGLWDWSGTTQTITTPGGATEINATPGAWDWSGTQAEIPTLIAATPGVWDWSGAQASTTQLINAGIGEFTWAGTQATTTQLINATPGVWDWSGTIAGIISQITIDATPGLWEWTGTRASIASTEQEATGGWPIYYPKRKKQDTEQVSTTEQALANLVATQARIEQRRELRKQERRAEYVTQQIRTILDEQDRLKMGIAALREQLELAGLMEQEILLILSLAS